MLYARYRELHGIENTCEIMVEKSQKFRIYPFVFAILYAYCQYVHMRIFENGVFDI